MSAYVVVEIEVKDPATYKKYKPLAPPSIAHMADAISCAEVRSRRSKVTGRPSGS